ncbi:MAG: hypothetical protein K2P58_15060 [Hyphomonadaceae bacterium]|nr:hypothetical protein [Hyphomonadaceae bacterium]
MRSSTGLANRKDAMVNTILFHAESDAAAAGQIATMLSARRAPLTFSVTQTNAEATAQLRIGANMTGLGVIGPNCSIEEMRRILAPILGVRKRALLVMPGASPPPEIAEAGAPVVRLEGDHATDAALLDNIDRYIASSAPRPITGRRPSLAVASVRTEEPAPPAFARAREDIAFDVEPTPAPRKSSPIMTVLLCASALVSLAVFVWRTFDLQRQPDTRPQSPFPAAITAPADQPSSEPANLESADPNPTLEADTLEAPVEEAPPEAPTEPAPDESVAGEAELRGSEVEGPVP